MNNRTIRGLMASLLVLGACWSVAPGWGWVGALEGGEVRLVPSRTYFSPGSAMTVRVESAVGVELLLTDFIGRSTSVRSGVVSGEVDLQKLFGDALARPGTYTLAAYVPGEIERMKFLGTPLVVQVREDGRRSAPPGPMVYRLEPLRYVKLHTTLGAMTAVFYYDTAPNTVETLLRLMREGFYEGLTFHRVEAGFVAQTGDPRGDGTGGPGFTLDPEFSDRQHLEGVLSMARMTDGQEVPGLTPRPEFAGTAGSQFFICLDYAQTRQLDRRFTAFGRVVEGLEVLRSLAKVEVEGKSFRPKSPVVIERVEVRDVTAADNPYAKLRVIDVARNEEEGK
jgi:cyclophilin family peptidyl-prolyl cis-trans isomerase